MDAIFLRSLALTAATDAACVTNASRTPADGTFALSSRSEGVIHVYAASCAALLHEFATIHPRVHALHYTSFSDSLVTLESDKLTVASLEDDTQDDADEETFLCVYHDWRERSMVRGYTLPLGVLDTPSSRRKADCVAVCSYTGRVVVAMGSVLNIWQCSQGFFEHVLELQVDMTQHDAYHVLEFVAIHGVYVSFGSSTEVRVMEVHVSSTKEAVSRVGIPVHGAHDPQSSSRDAENTDLPEDDANCVHFNTQDDLSTFESVSIPLASYGETSDESSYLHLLEKSMYNTEQDESPVVMDRDEALQEELSLAGVIKQQDVRVNQALNYYVADNDIRIIMRRYLPPNQRIQTLKFLPETIDNHVSLEARSYARLLVGTADHAFLYYFLSSEADATRKKMAKKVLGKGAFVRQASSALARSSPTSGAFDPSSSDDKPFDESAESGRVVMHYAFASPLSCITANSSFLYATSASSLQVWSIWSPCHQLAATRTLSSAVQLEPTQPRLISVQPLRSAVGEIAALYSYVVLLPPKPDNAAFEPRDLIRMTSSAAVELLPPSELEMRRDYARFSTSTTDDDREGCLMIFQQSPPSTIFSLVQSKQELRIQTRVDLLLSLYSLYRYRADVGANALAAAKERVHAKPTVDVRESMIVKLETTLYDRLACNCAAALATAFMGNEMRDLPRAVLFFEASKTPPSRVLRVFQELADKAEANPDQVVQATHRYLEACVFDSGRIRSRMLKTATSITAYGADFTRSVVSHYVEHATERLPHLVTNSSLVWTLEDLHFGLESLEAARVQDASLLSIARLVLLLKAQSVDAGGWDECLAKQPTIHSQMKTMCSPAAVGTTVDNVIHSGSKALLRLCVNRPDVLISEHDEGHASASALSQALLTRSPEIFASVLEAVFDSAIGRRESVFGSVLLCLSAIGDTIQPSIMRISARLTTCNHEQVQREFTTGDCVLVRLLCSVLDTFPRLHALAEKDEIGEDDDELLLMRRLLAMELLHASVALVSASQVASLSNTAARELASMFPEHTDVDGIPPWELEYLDARCLPRSHDTKLTGVTRHLLQRVLSLSNETKLLKAQDILSVYEPAPANDFAFLLVLRALPRKNRTIDGLRLLSDRDAFVELFLPYAKSFCSTLEEWKFLIETLSTMSEEADQTAAAPRSLDELGVLESVLNHVCSTLKPEDLLHVLPDDGDLALFMSTLETSVRVEAAHYCSGGRVASVAS